ncbi:MAG: hypothetical protein J7K26_00890 [Candidatus Aenigmarchaeota archaeon]|nr:hypothetical protein [Candidatus Aenigmarchaeota archaeon]
MVIGDLDIQGKIIDSNGNPIQGVQMILSNTTICYFSIGTNDLINPTDENGNYFLPVILDTGNSDSCNMILTADYNGIKETREFVVNSSDGYSQSITIDDIIVANPETSIYLFGTEGNNSWYISNVSVKLICSDYSGCDETRYKINNGPEQVYTGEFVISNEGVNTVSYYSIDNNGNNEIPKTQEIKIDKTAPVIESLGAKTKLNGNEIIESTWQTDNDPYFYWTTDGTQTGFSFALNQEPNNIVDTTDLYYQYENDAISDGEHIFHIKARDDAGNWGNELTFTIFVDSSTPDITEINAYTDNTQTTKIQTDYWQTDGSPYFIWTDPNSPSDNVFYYTLDGTEPNENSLSTTNNFYDHTSSEFQEGETIFKVKAKNNAGTWGKTIAFVLKFDKTKPFVSISGAPANWISGSATADLVVSDTVSGIESSGLCISNTQISSCPTDYALYNYSAPYSVSSHNWICGATRDNAGNINFTNPVEFKIDNNAPQYSQVIVTPNTPATYSPNQDYIFSIDITDDSGIKEVKFEFNGTEYTNILQNSDTYSITLSDLAAGTYSYRWYAKDLAGNEIWTDLKDYEIQRAKSNVYLIVQPSETLTYGESVTVICGIDNEEQTIILERNNTDVTSENNTAIILDAGNYIYNCTALESENYTSDSIQRTLIIKKAFPNIELIITPNSPVIYGTKITAICNIDNTEQSILLERNGTDIISENGTEVLLGAGTYNYSCTALESKNYNSANIEMLYTINKANPILHLTLNDLEQDLTVDYGTDTIANGWVEIGDSNATTKLLRNSIEVTNPDKHNNITGFLPVGTYTYMFEYIGSENYTSDSIQRTLTVDIIPGLTHLINTNIDGTYYTDTYVFEINSTSYINNSNITDSNFTISDVRNSELSNMNCTNAIIDNNYMYSGVCSYKGKTYDTPTNFSNIDDIDNENPQIIGITILSWNNNTLDLDLQVEAIDNIGVRSIFANQTKLNWLKNNLWEGIVNLLEHKDYYIIPINVTDYSDNSVVQNIVILTNNTNAWIDTEAPNILSVVLDPNPAKIGNEFSIIVDVSDNSVINSVNAKIENQQVLLSYINGRWRGTMQVPDSVGTYQVLVTATDIAGLSSQKTETLEVIAQTRISGGASGGGGGGIGSFFEPSGGPTNIEISVPETVTGTQGTTTVITVRVTNTGLTNAVNVVVYTDPIEWIRVEPLSVDLLEPGVSKDFKLVIDIPSDQSGSRTYTVYAKGEHVNANASKTFTLNIEGNPALCNACSAPTEWLACENGKQTRIVYTCDASTNYQCVETRETRPCGGITAYAIYVTKNPLISGIVGLILISIGYIGFKYFKDKEKFKKQVKNLFKKGKEKNESKSSSDQSKKGKSYSFGIQYK